MSNTIDSKVVEMRFDNSQFEANVRTSMSTLDKLKASLHLDGATKGLENINDSVKKVNFNPIGEGIEAVKMKFSALDVMAVTTLTNITNSVVNAGKRLISSFTIEPVTTGFNEFELKMGSVQTIMASTGESLDTVNKYLAELNEYSDKTIYSFSDMTNNIGKFTNAGVKLEDAVKAIKGISNEAAVSGANANEASRAMYNFAQALSAGYVKLIDWKSIENANMATVEFKQQLIDTAVELGTLTKTSDGMYQTSKHTITATRDFNDSLQDQWMTTDVLVTTLGKYADETTDIGKKAYASAQDVKTFSMMMDTLKEAAQSGWAETWEIIVGDFEQGKQLWTNLSNFFGDIIAKVSDARNAFLRSALGKGFSELSEKVNNFISPAKKAVDAVDKVTESVGDLGDIVNDVIVGKFGNGQERIDKLTESGQNYYRIQNKVNEVLGYSKRYTEEQIAAQDKLLGIQSETTAETEKEADVNAKLTKQQKLKIVQLGVLTEAQMREAGCTEDQIEAIQELIKTASKLGMPLDEFIDKMDEIDGRWLLLDSFKSIGKSLIEVFEAIGEAWSNVFPSTLEDKADTLFDIIAGFHKFSRGILDSATANADKLRRTFEGLFAALDIVRRVAGGALSFAFKLLQSVLSAMKLNILDVTASIGDAIKGFRDWIVEHDKITECINKLGEIIAKVITKVSEWINALLEIPVVSNIINNFGTIVSNTFDDLETHFANCKQAVIDFIERTKKLDGITIDNIRIAFKDFYENVLKKFFDVDGKFETLETTFKELGTTFENFITEKFGKPIEKVTETLNGFKDSIVNFVKKIATNLNDNVGMGEILTMLLGGSLVFSMVKMGKFLDSLVSPFQALTDIAGSVSGVLGNVSKAIKGFTLSIKAKAMLTIAAAIAVLAGSIWLLAQLDAPTLWSTIGAIAVLGVILGGLTVALGAFSKLQSIDISAKTMVSIIALASAIGVLVLCLKSLDDIENNIVRNIGIITLFMIELGAFAAVMSKMKVQMTIGAMALIGIAGAIKIMVSALKDLDDMAFDHLGQDLLILGGIMAGLTLIAVAANKIGGFGAGVAILAMAISLKIIISALKDITIIDADSIKNSLDAIVTILGTFIILMAVSRLAGNNAAKAGIGILAMSAAMILLVGAIKMLSTMSASDLNKATKVISDMFFTFGLIVALSKFAGENARKAGTMLLLMSGAMAILAGIAVVLSHVDPEGLDKAVNAISQIMIIFGLIVACSGFAKNVKTGSLIAIAVALGILTFALGALAMIETENLKSATAAISIVIGMFALLAFASKYTTEAIGSLTVMTVAVGLLGGLLIAMSMLKVNNALENAIGLSALLLAISASLKILDTVGSVSAKVIGSMALIGLVVGELAIILGLMSYFKVDDALENAIGLSALLLAVSAACFIASKIPVSSAVEGAAGLSAFIFIVSGIMAGLTTIFGLIEDTSYIERGAETLAKIGYALGDFVGSIIGGLGAGITSGLPEMGQNISDFMNNLQGFFDTASSIDESSMNGIKNLVQTLLMLTGANLLDAITSWLTGGSSLSDFAQELSGFAEGLKGYVEVVDGIEWTSVEPSINAARKLVEFGSELPNHGGLKALIAGDNTLQSFGQYLSTFASGLKTYIKTVSGIDWSPIDPSITAAKKLLDFSNMLPNHGGLKALIAGDNTLSSFASGMTTFAKQLVSYAETVNGVDWSGIGPSVTAAGQLKDLVNTLPTLGGVVGWWSGDNGFDNFTDGLAKFGKQMASYAESVLGVDWSGIGPSVTAAGQLRDLVNSLPVLGGVVGWWNGDQGFDDFTKGLAKFGKQMASYAESVLGVDWSGVGPSVTAAGKLKDLLKSLPTKKAFDGKMTLSKFGSQIKDFATDIVKFAEKIVGINITQLSSAISEMNKLANLLNNISGMNFSGTSSFVTAVDELGKVSVDNIIASFNNGSSRVTNAVSQLFNSAVNAARSGAQRVATAFSSMMTVSSNTVVTGGAVIITSFNSILTKTLNIIHSKISSFLIAGRLCATSFSVGLSSGQALAIIAAIGMVSTAASILSAYRTSFYSAGAYLAEGFTAGITSNSFKAEAAATAMAEKALDAAKDVLDINSPSKEFFKIGKFTAEGLANGIEKNTKLPKAAAGSLAQGIMDEYKKVSKSMNFGTGAMKAYIRQYGKMSTDMEYNNKVLKKASSLITEYGEKLYKETEQYEKDNKQLDEHKKKLDELQKEREEILKKDTSGKNADKVKKNLESIDKKIDETKQKIIDDEKAIQEHTADAFNKVRDSIKDSLSDSMDMLSTSLDSGIDLFKKFKEEAKAETWNVDPFSEFSGDSDLTKQQILDNMKSQSDGLSKWKLKLDLLASKGISDELLTYLKDLGPSGSKYIEEFMKMTGAELEKADNYYKNIIAKSTKEASTEDYLANMQSQVDGIREWRADIEKLANTNLADGLIEELKALGPEGADQIKYFLNLTAEEIEKANSLYNDKLSLSLETFLGNYADNQKAVKKWSNDMSKLVEKDFSPDIIKALGDAGMDKSKSLIEVLLNMTPEQVKKFNEDFAKSSSLSESAANSIMADYANAGKNSAKAFKEGFKTEVTDSSDEENSIVGSLTRMELGSVATDAIESGEKDVENSTTDMSEDSANAIETETVNEWELAGKCCVEGFAKGITENTFMAQARAIAMAKAALEAAEAELGVASPSKKFIRIGEYVSEGFAIGINNYANQPVDSITNLSDTILANASNVVNGINNAMDGKINARPTISPVVDMDNVNTESLHFTSMLDAVLTEPVTSIGETMANLQAKIEESNSKVTNAINGLRDDMNSYYSGDDSEIALYVDSKKLASSLARPMNNQLNILSKRGAY